MIHVIATISIADGQRDKFLEEFRKIIEPDIAAMAATRHDAGDLDLILQDVGAMKESIENLDAFLEHDYHFHLHIAQASRNQILI